MGKERPRSMKWSRKLKLSIIKITLGGERKPQRLKEKDFRVVPPPILGAHPSLLTFNTQNLSTVFSKIINNKRTYLVTNFLCISFVIINVSNLLVDWFQMKTSLKKQSTLGQSKSLVYVYVEISISFLRLIHMIGTVNIKWE